MISFASPAREHDAQADAIERAVLEVLRSGRYVLGEPVARFEADLARFLGSPWAVAVSSGTDALACALHALGVGPGHEVIVPAFGFVSAAEAALRTGASPVFVDVEPISLGPAPGAVAAALGPRTRALVVMHLFGQVVDLDPLRRFAPGLPIVEDAAQAFGATRGGRSAGTLGDLGTLSFFPGKTLGCAGDGGAVVGIDPALEARVHRARAHGAGGAYEWTGAGGNYRLDAVQAAVLGVKLEAFGARVARRRAIGERLACAAERAGAVALCGGSGCAPVFSSLALRARGRDRVVARLRERGVDARVQYPRTLPASEAFRSLVAPGARYPEAERATRELLSVPCHPELTDDEVALLESALVEALRDG